MAKGILLHTDMLEGLAEMSRPQKGMFVEALLAWRRGEAYAAEDEAVRIFFAVAKKRLEDYDARYQEQCERKRENGKKGGKRSVESRKTAETPKQEQASPSSCLKVLEGAYTSKQLQALPSKSNNTNTNTNTNTNSNFVTGEGAGPSQATLVILEGAAGAGRGEGETLNAERSTLNAERSTLNAEGESTGGTPVSRGGGEAAGVRYDKTSGRFVCVPAALKEGWRRVCPQVDVEMEIERAGVWLAENPRRMKKDFRKFLGAWMRRAQGDAGTGDGGRETGDGGRETGNAGRNLNTDLEIH